MRSRPRNRIAIPDRDNFKTIILSDLYETIPVNPLTIPSPINDNLSFEQNITDLYVQLRRCLRTSKRIEGLLNAFHIGEFLETHPMTNVQRRRCKSILTKHYRQCCQRIYDLFSIPGKEQIYRTRRTNFWMFRFIKKNEYLGLLNDAEDLIVTSILNVDGTTF
jgi:hypothetical protein